MRQKCTIGAVIPARRSRDNARCVRRAREVSDRRGQLRTYLMRGDVGDIGLRAKSRIASGSGK